MYNTIRLLLSGTAATEIYTLSLHDALPICPDLSRKVCGPKRSCMREKHRLFLALWRYIWIAKNEIQETAHLILKLAVVDRKSTRLNSSHSQISYAVFCLKKKN